VAGSSAALCEHEEGLPDAGISVPGVSGGHPGGVRRPTKGFSCPRLRGQGLQGPPEGGEEGEAVALWTSFYLDRAAEHLRNQGAVVREEDLARGSPLVREHVHLLGRYQFTLKESVAGGGVRPLRDPAEIDEYELTAPESSL
jgi:hypothetical protein